MVEQDVAALDRGPDVGRVRELRDQLRDHVRVADLREPRQPVHLEQSRQVDHPLDRVHIRHRVEVERGGQELHHFVRGVRFQFEPDGRPPAPLPDRLLDRLQQVLDFLVLDLVLAVAGDPEGGRVVDRHAREQVVQPEPDRGFQRGEDDPFVGRELDEPPQHGRHLDDGE